jgi:hypothetical protein
VQRRRTMTLWMGALVLVAGPWSVALEAKPPVKPLTAEEEIAACVTLRERANECRELFIDELIDLRTRRTVTPMTKEQRQASRAKGVADLQADATGPLEPRRKKCAADLAVAKANPPPPVPDRADVAKLDRCYRHKDCKQRVDCMLAVIDGFTFSTRPAAAEPGRR